MSLLYIILPRNRRSLGSGYRRCAPQTPGQTRGRAKQNGNLTISFERIGEVTEQAGSQGRSRRQQDPLGASSRYFTGS
jgi:hypothetical protein